MTELSEAISEAMPEALNEYLTRMETLYGTNYETISVRKEITFEPLGVTLKIGSLLFFERGDIDQSTFEVPLFRIKSALDNFLDSLSLKEEQGDYSTVTMDNGEEAKLFSTDEELLFTMEPYTLEGREPFVTLGELSLWAIHQWFKDNGKDSPVPVFLYKIFPTLYPESEEPEELPLFTTPLDGIITAHSLTNKLIDSLSQIAFMNGTQGKVTITPRGGKSNEEYSVMASPAACSDYYGKRGNSELLKAIANIVHTIARDEHAGEFVAEGRVWFTAAKVARELSRTEGGTINPHQYSKVKEGTGIIPLVEHGLVALSSAQFSGQKPDGTTVNLAYMCNLERRERIMCNGEEYSNVWGVLPANPGGIGSYSEALGQSWRYPLLPSLTPLGMDEAGYKTYLEQILNELRSRLWTTDRSGNPKASNAKSAKATRKYKDTFRAFSPLSDLTSRQKRRVIAGLEAMLKQLAQEEAKGTRREGMPLTITATSKRDASRGRGKGEWVSFTITAKRSSGKVAIDLLGND